MVRKTKLFSIRPEKGTGKSLLSLGKVDLSFFNPLKKSPIDIAYARKRNNEDVKIFGKKIKW